MVDVYKIKKDVFLNSEKMKFICINPLRTFHLPSSAKRTFSIRRIRSQLPKHEMVKVVQSVWMSKLRYGLQLCKSKVPLKFKIYKKNHYFRIQKSIFFILIKKIFFILIKKNIFYFLNVDRQPLTVNRWRRPDWAFHGWRRPDWGFLLVDGRRQADSFITPQ